HACRGEPEGSTRKSMQRHHSRTLEVLAELGEDIVLLEYANGIAEVTTEKYRPNRQRTDQYRRNRQRNEWESHDQRTLVRLDGAMVIVPVTVIAGAGSSCRSRRVRGGDGCSVRARVVRGRRSRMRDGRSMGGPVSPGLDGRSVPESLRPMERHEQHAEG